MKIDAVIRSFSLIFGKGGRKRMNITDPIADMLTRIRNASRSKHKTVDVPASNLKKSIADILFKEGYIKAYEEIANEDTTQGIIRITLKLWLRVGYTKH